MKNEKRTKEEQAMMEKRGNWSKLNVIYVRQVGSQRTGPALTDWNVRVGNKWKARPLEATYSLLLLTDQ